MFIALKRCCPYHFRSILQYVPKYINNSHYRHEATFAAEKLLRRQLIKVSGDTSSDFLQGLMTNDMRVLENNGPSLYCMFLNIKGRVLFDSIIYPAKVPNEFLIECDGECAPNLIKHLNMYKVRRKIDISLMDSELCAWALYNCEHIDNCLNNNRAEIDQSSIETILGKYENAILVSDPRIPTLGYRAITKVDQDLTSFLPKGYMYDIYRYKLGVGEGLHEFELGQSFPLEMNCDYLNGVSFDKGCYIGQEVTARTFHTGVIRKRLMPLVFDSELSGIPYNTPIEDVNVKRKTPIGKLKAIKGRYGLGLMRVSETLEGKSLKMLENMGKCQLPFWWPKSFNKMN